jgi:3',5'-cyclic AMP phosphodiesterase CpdA
MALEPGGCFKMRNILIIITIVFISGCELESSPWATDPDCDNLNIQYNIDLLKEKEKTEGRKNYFKAAIVGDTQQWIGKFDNIISEIKREDNIDFLLLLGDLTEMGLKTEFEWVCKALEDLNIPVIAVIGNHDAISYGQEIWKNNIGAFDYSFDYQGTKFIAYNDNKYEFKNVPDRDWLASEADGYINRNHTIGLSHSPPWDTDIGLSDYLKKSGFNYMLHAHNHKLDHWQFTSVLLPHYVVDDAKDEFYGIIEVRPDSISLDNCSFGCYTSLIRNIN